MTDLESEFRAYRSSLCRFLSLQGMQCMCVGEDVVIADRVYIIRRIGDRWYAVAQADASGAG